MLFSYLLLAPIDYLRVLGEELRFLPNGANTSMMCVNITIMSDDVVENTETFLASLRTDDTRVNLGQTPNTSVIITDNSSEFFKGNYMYLEHL